MKRILSLLLAAALLVGLLCCTALADGKPELALTAASAAPGEELELTLSLRNNPGVKGLSAELDYDAAALTLLSATPQIGVGTWMIDSIAEDRLLYWYSPTSYTGEEIAVLRFRVNENAPTGAARVGLRFGDWDGLYDAAGEEITDFTVTPGTVTVKAASFVSTQYTGKGWKTNFADTVYLNAQDTTYLNLVVYVNTSYAGDDKVSFENGRFVLNFGALRNVEIPLSAFDTSYDTTDVEMKVAMAEQGYYAYVDSSFYTVRVPVNPNHMHDAATLRLYDGDRQTTLYRNTGGQVFGAASWSAAGYELWSLEDGYSQTTYDYLVELQNDAVYGDFAEKMIAYGEAARAIPGWN